MLRSGVSEFGHAAILSKENLSPEQVRKYSSLD